MLVWKIFSKERVKDFLILVAQRIYFNPLFKLQGSELGGIGFKLKSMGVRLFSNRRELIIFTGISIQFKDFFYLTYLI